MLNKETVERVVNGVAEVAKGAAMCAVIGLTVCRTYKLIRDTTNYLEKKVI